MKDFIDIRFPDDISYGSISGPEFNTDIITLNNGKEQRNIKNYIGKNKFIINYTLKNKKQINSLINFFRARYGRAQSFRFKDWTDYLAINSKLKIIDKKQKIYQLKKDYGDNDNYQERIITKPVQGTIKLYSKQHNFKENMDFYVDYSKGRIFFNIDIDSSVEIYADYEFDVPTRFEDDFLPIIIDNNNIMSVKNLKLIEVI